MRRLHLDVETRSALDLKKVGMHVYAEHPTTSLNLLRYRFDGDDVVSGWRRGEPFPDALVAHVDAGGIVVAHNAAFERQAWNVILPRQLGFCAGVDWPWMTPEQQDCTMIRAYAAGLPGSLELVASILDVPVQKDMKGSANMKTLARPRRRHADGTLTWWDEPERIDRLWSYCGDDVQAEEGIDAVLPALSADDEAVWVLDQKMNERGVYLDMTLIERMQAVVTIERESLNAKMSMLTGGVVRKCSERAKLVAWLESRGIMVTSLSNKVADEVDDILTEHADPLSTRAIEIYRSANRTSTAKLAKMAETVCADGRSRGTMQYHGAFTGRWAGRLWQPQNLKRMDEDRDGPMIRAMSDALLTLRPEQARDFIDAASGDVMESLSLGMRSVVCAAPGHELLGADYSNIEGRVIAWLSNARAKLDAYAEQDRGGAEMYKLSYVSSFGGIIEDVTKALRQIGKVQELALQYQGSIGAFISMAGGLNIKLADITRVVFKVCTQADYDAALSSLKQPGTHMFGLDEETWIGLKIVVSNWRKGDLNAPIAQFWWDLQDAALEAIQSEGTIVPVGAAKLVSYCMSRGVLWCRLPTGKCLGYMRPRVKTSVVKRIGRDGAEYEQVRHSVEFDGYDGERRRWCPQTLYGGLQANHVTQGTAAVIMKRGMRNLDVGRGMWAAAPHIGLRQYPSILTVHDEAMTEVKAFNCEETAKKHVFDYEKLMLDVGDEFAGLPLAAKGWSDRRYVK